MRLPFVVAALVLACSSSRTSGERDAQAAPDAAPSLCVRLCDAAARVPCADRTPACVADCERALMHPTCANEASTYATCRLAAGEGALVCENGRTLLRKGVCAIEESAFVACVRR